MNTILYVDDDPTFQVLLRRLIPATLALEFASRGDDALSRVEHAVEPFAVIIADLWLPGMDGLKLLTAVRTCAPVTTRVMLTGDPRVSSDPSLATDAAPFRLILKPVHLADLRAAVNEAVAHHEDLIGRRIVAGEDVERLAVAAA